MAMFIKKYVVITLALTVSSPLYAASLTNHLKSLQADYQQKIGNQTGQTFQPKDESVPVVKNDKVIVTLMVKNKTIEKVKSELLKKGMTDISVYKNLMSGVFPISRLNELENVSNISSISTSQAFKKGFTSWGNAYNSADTAMFTDVVRKSYNVDGSGITIGVMSDSYNCLNTASKDVESGDLPKNVKVVKEYPFCADGGTDEGRAMLQLIHDIAPNAKLLFRTAFISEVDMAAGILELKKAGANIIVDDVGWLTALMFQDGPAAQAVDEVTAAGVTYFSSAGNSARLSYESDFVAGKANSGDTAHDFGKAAGQASDFYQPIFIPQGTKVKIALQWDDASKIADVENKNNPTAKTDLDIFLLDSDKKTILTSSQDSNVGHDAVEYTVWASEGTRTEDQNYYLYISHRAGKAPAHIKYIIFAPPVSEPTGAEPMLWGEDVYYLQPNETKKPYPSFKKPDGTFLDFFQLANLATDDENDRYPNGKAIVAIKKDKNGKVVKANEEGEYKFETLNSKIGQYYRCLDKIKMKNCRIIPDVDDDGNIEIGHYTVIRLVPDPNNPNVLVEKEFVVTYYYIDFSGVEIRFGSDEYPVWYVPVNSTIRLTDDMRMEIVPVSTKIKKYDTQSSTIFGHPNAAGAIAVGAISYQETPWFGVDLFNSKIESFSSAGGTPIYFDKNGKRKAAPEYRPKPEIVAVDNVDTTFFGSDDSDNNGLPNFFGTSAAAPNAAAAAALLLQNNKLIKPDRVKSLMMQTASPLNDLVTFTETPVSPNPCFPESSTPFSNWGAGCGLLQADLLFEKAMQENFAEQVFLTLEANKENFKAGDSVNYKFRVSNQTSKSLSNVKIVAAKIPQFVTFGDVDGCQKVEASAARFSCTVGELAPRQSAVINVPVTTQNNPKKMLSFNAYVSANEKFDKKNASAALDIPVEILIADLNEDGCVDALDYGVLFGVFRTGIYNKKYDLFPVDDKGNPKPDGKINAEDLKQLKTKYAFPDGASCSGSNL
jgi:subtilisin family serine protease